MSQSNFIHDGQSSARDLRLAFDASIKAAASSNSAASFPTVTYPGMPYASDVTGDYYIRNSSNSAWTPMGNINTGIGGGDPVGRYVTDARDDLGPNYLRCEGQAVGRTTYAELFAIYGISQGAGDGATTFNIYDARGKGMVYPASGVAGVPDRTVGESGGAEEVSLTAANNGPHAHGVNRANASAAANGFLMGATGAFRVDVGMYNSGSGTPFSIMNPYGVPGYLFIRALS